MAEDAFNTVCVLGGTFFSLPTSSLQLVSGSQYFLSWKNMLFLFCQAGELASKRKEMGGYFGFQSFRWNFFPSLHILYT